MTTVSLRGTIGADGTLQLNVPVGLPLPLRRDHAGRRAAMPDFGDVPEMHDRLIVVAADRLAAMIIAVDHEIRSSTRAKCLR